MYKNSSESRPSSTGGFSKKRTSFGSKSASRAPAPSFGGTRGGTSYAASKPVGRGSFGASRGGPRTSSYGARSSSFAPRSSAPRSSALSYGAGFSTPSYGVRPSSSGSSTSYSSGPRYTPGSARSGGSSSRFGGHSSRAAGRSGGYSSGPRGRGGSRGGGFKGSHINTSMFINKAVVTETSTPHFKPDHTFADFTFDERLKANIAAKGFTLPTPIQDKAIPMVMKGSDVVGIANTGTGKTAAFALPLINKCLLNPKEEILVVVPTRELAVQIEEEIKSFIKGMKIYAVSCVGGTSMRKQIQELRYLNNFVIGTPGRLKDLIERKYINLALFKTVILDEADRMLDMGFVNDMRFMMDLMPKDRQTLFFSATLSSEIESLIGAFLNEPVRISVKTQATSANVDQDVVRVERGGDKMQVLHDLLNKEDFSKVLIFGKTKHGVERLSKELITRGFKAESIHGDKNFVGRQRALTSFKNDQIQILVATDVAARGLDISDVTHVINYDLPQTYEDYVHRIGRTGRGGKKGKALTFVQ